MKEIQFRTQSRRASLAEAFGNIVVGLGIQMLGAYTAFKLLGVHITWTQFTWFTFAMTILSVVRQYILRRLWNAEWWKRIEWGWPLRLKPRYVEVNIVQRVVAPQFPVDVTDEEMLALGLRLRRSMDRKLEEELLGAADGKANQS